jgi:hypothetical protein
MTKKPKPRGPYFTSPEGLRVTKRGQFRRIDLTGPGILIPIRLTQGRADSLARFYKWLSRKLTE